jgi:hypothetical protein
MALKSCAIDIHDEGFGYSVWLVSPVSGEIRRRFRQEAGSIPLINPTFWQ